MADVFISYAHDDDDAKFAENLEQALRSTSIASGDNQWSDITVFRDAVIPNGARWRKEIDAQLRAATLIVVIISPASMASAYVTYEWCYSWFALSQSIGNDIYWIYYKQVENGSAGIYSRIYEEFQLPLKQCLNGSLEIERFIVEEIKERLLSYKEIIQIGEKLCTPKPPQGTSREEFEAFRRDRLSAAQALGNQTLHHAKARFFLHKGIKLLISTLYEEDGEVMLAIGAALMKVGDASSLAYLWIGRNSRQIQEWKQDAIQSMDNKISALSHKITNGNSR